MNVFGIMCFLYPLVYFSILLGSDSVVISSFVEFITFTFIVVPYLTFWVFISLLGVCLAFTMLIYLLSLPFGK